MTDPRLLDPFKFYRKKQNQLMRPFINGEDRTLLSISPGVIPMEGGMVAINIQDPTDQWYVTPDFFLDNYVLD